MKGFQIKRSGAKRYVYILGCLLMTAVCSISVITQRAVVVGVIGMLFFGLGTFVIIWLTFGHPLLTLTSEGFTDSSSAVSAGFIPWKTVSNMAIVELFGQTFISVCLKDTESYLGTLSSFKRKMAESNLAMGYGPINIALLGTSMRPEDVLSRMMEFWATYRNDTQSPILTPPAIDNTAQNG